MRFTPGYIHYCDIVDYVDTIFHVSPKNSSSNLDQYKEKQEKIMLNMSISIQLK